MNKTKVLITGSSSLVGSHFVENFGSKYQISALGRKDIFSDTDLLSSFEKVDIQNKQELSEALCSSDAQFVINYAAVTNVDECELERGDESGQVYLVNTESPVEMAKICKERNKRFFQISTDFVFDGSCGPYSEQDPAGPIKEKLSWYGQTKYMAEEKIKAIHSSGCCLIRISYPYRAKFQHKSDFARNILDLYNRDKLYPLFSDQIFSPTLIDDVSNAVDFLIRSPTEGVFHVAAKYPTTPYNFALKLISTFYPEKSIDGIRKGSIIDFNNRPGKAPRPVKSGLKTEKVQQLGLPVHTIEDGIRTMLETSGHGEQLG